MTLQLEIKPETFDALDAEAKARALTLEAYIMRVGLPRNLTVE